MSQEINLRVWLKIPDAEAATVKNTLVRRMGFADLLADVKKERLFCITVDSGDLQEMAGAFADLMASMDETTREILARLARGERHREIAAELRVTRQAVTNRVRNLRGRFQMAGLVPSGTV